ncbi:MAG: hypothetical protein IKF17_01880 [Clostridia bacterium]|nr:hypothetical protein [Clostridia bacterium]
MKEKKEKNPIMSETKKQILINGIFAVLIILSFIGIFVAYNFLKEGMFTRIWQYLTMIILGISIAIFEIAYKKDSGILAINGIEVLLLSCYILTLEYIKIRFGIDVKIYTIIAGIIFLVYFLFKTILIYTSGRKKLLKSLSDIADIVKEDAPKKKAATKRKKGEDEKND